MPKFSKSKTKALTQNLQTILIIQHIDVGHEKGIMVM
jgi:hypothetical protein